MFLHLIALWTRLAIWTGPSTQAGRTAAASHLLALVVRCRRLRQSQATAIAKATVPQPSHHITSLLDQWPSYHHQHLSVWIQRLHVRDPFKTVADLSVLWPVTPTISKHILVVRDHCFSHLPHLLGCSSPRICSAVMHVQSSPTSLLLGGGRISNAGAQEERLLPANVDGPQPTSYPKSPTPSPKCNLVQNYMVLSENLMLGLVHCETLVKRTDPKRNLLLKKWC